MDNFLANLNQLAERFRELPQNKKAGVLALIAIAVGSLFAMSLWVQAPDYQLLYSNLSPQDASAIVDKLKSQKIPFELSNQGKTIHVASNVVHELRLQLAGEGLPEGNDVGLDTNAEDLDAYDVLPDGRIIISTTGNPSVPGVSGADEDLLAFSNIRIS